MTQSQDQQLHAIVHGRVQGVGFRDFTLDRAADLGLSGWVRNQSDGTVEVTAEGDHATLDRFLELLHRGPSLARVTRGEIEWQAASGNYRSFSVR